MFSYGFSIAFARCNILGDSAFTTFIAAGDYWFGATVVIRFMAGCVVVHVHIPWALA
jgi:hypothetical protein